MRIFSLSLLLALLLVAVAEAQHQRTHTFSIVARDPLTGELGVAVQSHWFSVGAVVPWAESGVGAVATQSISEPAYGAMGLVLMRGGRTAPDALRALVTTDAQAEYRQVAMIDAAGNVAAHTGKLAIAEAGHHIGKDYSVQANLMKSSSVWPAMAVAFERASGDLADRMIAALEAGQSAGGDIRGRQSAAIIVVRGRPSGKPWTDRLFDLRVEDHVEPIAELKRLVKLQRAYNLMNRGDELSAEQKWTEAMEHYRKASKLAPEIEELRFWTAVTLFTAGREEEALPIFREVFAKNSEWIEVTRRLPASGLLPKDEKKIARIVAEGKRP